MRWLGIIGITVVAIWGCSLEESLENAPCNDADDCLGDYVCHRTLHQQASGGVGLCRPDASCAIGVQNGCLAGDSDCGNGLTPIADATGTAYCCAGGSSVINGNGVEAQCISCATDLCNGQGDATEECTVGQPRCVAVQDMCGCRVPENLIENSPCDDDDTCGEGFVCTRTAEQDAEPNENNEQDQAPEPGWCRPEDSPECVAGSQPGCDEGGSCGSGVNEACIDENCYCCEPPASSEYRAIPYVHRSSDNTIACVDCLNNCSTVVGSGSVACTDVTAADCDLNDGVCGCTPASG